MRITSVSRGVLHVIESVDGQMIRFQADPSAESLTLMAMIEQVGKNTGYDVSQYAKAKITLIVETDDSPQYQQTL